MSGGSRRAGATQPSRAVHDVRKAGADRAGALASRSGAQTLARGLDLIERVVDEPMTVRDLAASAGLTLQTTRRLTATLVQSGFLSHSRGGRFRAGPKLVQLGVRGQSQLNFRDIAREPLEALSEATGAPSFLGERDRDHSVHLHRVEGTQRVTVSTPVGTRRQLAETSLGKALLLDDPESEWDRLFAEAGEPFRPVGWKARMRQFRTTGVVIHDAASPDRIRAIAAPVRDASGRIVAAISIVMAAQYADDERVRQFAPLVAGAARAISEQLGMK